MASVVEHFAILDSLAKNGINIKFKRFQPNPMVKLKSDNIDYDHADCITRAIVRLTNESYDEIFDRQLKLAKIYCLSSDHIDIAKEILKRYNYFFNEVRNSTVLSFCITHMTGRYGICTDYHMFAFINGTIYDSFTGCHTKEERKMCVGRILYSSINGYFALRKKLKY